MKGMNKKGFTLIELLAVIVVLAIVMVLAATTVLPYMAESRKQAFVTEAETLKKAASQAVSFIQIGTITDDYTAGDGDYCFSVDQLKTLGLFKKDDDNYKGVVVVSKNDKSYQYLVKMKNKDFYVSQTASGNIEKDDVKDVVTGTNAVPTAAEVPESCS